MEGLDDHNKILFINGIKYLQRLSNSIPDEFTVLKSFYSAKYRILEERTNVKLKSEKGRRNQRCARCCLKLVEGPASYQIKPQRLSKFAKKLIRLKTENNRELWTRYQTRYLKRLDTTKTNYLVSTCKFCTKKNVVLLPKPKMVKQKQVLPKVRKVKKKKDKLCGLNVEAVLSAKPKVSKNTKPKAPTLNNRIVKRKNERKLQEITKLLANSKTKKPTNKLANFLQSL